MDSDARRADTILIVDDEGGIRDALSRAFRRAMPHVRILEAEDAQAALALLLHEPVDLIVSDHRMPGMSGMEFLERAHAIAPEVPRMMITAYADLDLVLRGANAAHLARFLPKPFPLELAVRVASELLDERHATRLRQAAMRRAEEAAARFKAKP